MINYKITYAEKTLVGKTLVTKSIKTIELTAKDTNDARTIFKNEYPNAYIKTIERVTPKPKNSKGSKISQKELAKKEEKKQIKKDKNKKWLEKHPESNLAKKKNKRKGII